MRIITGTGINLYYGTIVSSTLTTITVLWDSGYTVKYLKSEIKVAPGRKELK